LIRALRENSFEGGNTRSSWSTEVMLPEAFASEDNDEDDFCFAILVARTCGAF
jgi:hypothetical protein